MIRLPSAFSVLAENENVLVLRHLLRDAVAIVPKGPEARRRTKRSRPAERGARCEGAAACPIGHVTEWFPCGHSAFRMESSVRGAPRLLVSCRAGRGGSTREDFGGGRSDSGVPTLHVHRSPEYHAEAMPEGLRTNKHLFDRSVCLLPGTMDVIAPPELSLAACVAVMYAFEVFSSLAGVDDRRETLAGLSFTGNLGPREARALVLTYLQLEERSARRLEKSVVRFEARSSSILSELRALVASRPEVGEGLAELELSSSREEEMYSEVEDEIGAAQENLERQPPAAGDRSDADGGVREGSGCPRGEGDVDGEPGSRSHPGPSRTAAALRGTSNNRAGIVVTLPSARYKPSANCLETKMLNRHVPERGASSNSSRVYSVRELAAIVSDMAKWGVSRYSLGYLDYTFGGPPGLPFFTELSLAIDSATAEHDSVCYDGKWRDASAAVSTAARDYGRALREVDSAFGHLTAVVNTRVGRNVAMDSMESGLPLSHSPDRVDVMMDHRALIEETRAAAISTARRFAARGTEDGGAPLRNAGKFLGRMNSWKTGALLLSFQLNSATFALIGARERLLACARGVLRSDMTGCAPGFRPEFYTDVPAASRSPPSSSPSSGLVLEVRRDRWNPVSLSRWYMAFVDSSQGNRTCWLDRSMLNDSRSDYREPRCDRRGLCDPLELDDDTLAACDVRQDGEVSSECPLACGSPCFSPLCYKRRSSSYELRVAVDLDPESAEILVASKPRILSKAYSVSEEDARASLAQMRERAGRALEQLDRGVSVVHALKQMNSKLRSCADRIDSGNVKCLRETVECRRSVVRGGAVAPRRRSVCLVVCERIFCSLARIERHPLTLAEFAAMKAPHLVRPPLAVVWLVFVTALVWCPGAKPVFAQEPHSASLRASPTPDAALEEADASPTPESGLGDPEEAGTPAPSASATPGAAAAEAGVRDPEEAGTPAPSASATPTPESATGSRNPEGEDEVTETPGLWTSPDGEADETCHPGEPKLKRRCSLVLACPSWSPERFVATAWYRVEKNGEKVGLFRATRRRSRVERYRYWLGEKLKNTHRMMDSGDLAISVRASCHALTYQCSRWANVGYRNEDHRFTVLNCTVVEHVIKKSHPFRGHHRKPIVPSQLSTRR
ncbi:hypothetical protein Q5P01_016592 [Channa striata]|uniref:Uncharacterized protein n=1 Tax=Channa striata TaxID=64152 RepID=A0AA88SI38_CHASR|nr:hypothetical protein Q5P01_016592 [Channa striata]